MGTYSKPGITNAEANLVGNPAAALSKAISGVGITFNTQIANMEASKNALTESTAALNQQANAIETSNTPNAASQTQDIIKKEIDRIYKLKYNSIGRDQSEAIKAESDLLNMVKKMPEIMAFYDEETNLYKKNIENGQAGNTISNIRTNKNSRGFYQSNAFENGKGIEVKYQDGQLLFAYGKGKDRFEQNAMNYYDGVKGGADSNVGYIDSNKYQGAYKATFTQYAKEFPALITKIETENKGGGITNTTKKVYNQQVDIIKDKLMNDRQLLNDIDSDEFQFLVGSAYLTPEGENEAFTGTSDQIKRAQEAKVNYIMDQFAKVEQGEIVNGKFVIGDAQEITTLVDSNLENKSSSDPNNSNKDFGQKTAANLESIVLDINKSPNKTNINKLIGQKINGNEIASVTVDDGIVKVYGLIDEVQIVDGKEKTIQKSRELSSYDTNDDSSSVKFTQKLFQGSGLGISAQSNTVMENIQEDMQESLSEIKDEKRRKIETTRRVKLSEKLKSSNAALYKKLPETKRKEIFNGFSQTEAYKEYQAIKKGKSSRDYRVVEAEYNYQKAQEDYLKNVIKNNNTTFDPKVVTPPNNIEQPEVKSNIEVKATQPSSRDLEVENKKQEALLREAEITYGGKSGDDTYGLTDYKDYDFKYYLNSEEQVQEGVKRDGKMATYWGGDQPKKGLKKDLGEKVYDGLSDGQQAMMRMQHVNIGWDPRVTMLLASGVITPDERSKYLRDYKKTTTKYNDNKAKFKNIDDQAMFDQWVDLYANTEGKKKGLQKQYKRRVEDMAKSYGFKLTKEQLDLFKV